MKMIRRANHSSAVQVLPLQTTTTSQGSQSHRRKQQPQATSSSPTKSSFSPILQKKGSISLRPGIVAAFGIFAVAAFFAVHIYLFTTVSGKVSFVEPHPIISAVHAKALVIPEPTAIKNIITPLRPLDREQYTIRINTFQRTEQLRISLHHHATCDAVLQIQVVWCTAQGEPPAWLLNFGPKVVVELHDVNSLSERFRILLEPPTAGILTIDDDVLRPCIAMDAGFVKWVDNPDRMVGFDARGHGIVDAATKGDRALVGPGQPEQEDEDEQHWAYSYLSTTEKTNKYSLTLTRYAFVHRDYLDSYFSHMPAVIRETVATNMNCEDIAMSFWVSSQTDGRAPLLADFWAIKTQLKLNSANAISSTKNHKAARDACVESFANVLQLKSRLSLTHYIHQDNDYSGLYECGASGHKPARETVPSKKQVELHTKKRKWKKEGKESLFRDLGPRLKEMRAGVSSP
jgi:glucuronyl/N-acetylglucosaminyl transferase EXT2